MILSQYRATIFAIRTSRRDTGYSELQVTLGDALVHAAKLGAGKRMSEDTADKMAAYLLDGMLPTASMPNDYGPIEEALQQALDKGEKGRQRAVGMAQALAMIKYPRAWSVASGKVRARNAR